MGPTPLLEFFKRGEVARDVRLLAAQGALAPRAGEQLGILVLLAGDADPEIRRTAESTLARIPDAALVKFLGRPDTPAALRDFFAGRGIVPAEQTAEAPAEEPDAPLIDASPALEGRPEDATEEATEDENESSESVTQRLAKMGFSARLKAAVKGSREMRAILVRDPNKMIAAAVLSSPKLTEPEVETIARMANVSEEVLRTIGSNRAWTKNYSVVLGLTKNPKTPLTMAMNLMHRLSDRDLNQLAVDRNVPEPLRQAARKKVLANTSRG